MPIVLDDHGTVLVPWSELGTARPEPAPQSCDKCGKVCEEVPPERHGLCRVCATERRAAAAQHDEDDRRLEFNGTQAWWITRGYGPVLAALLAQCDVRRQGRRRLSTR